jgi:hypothetical protein
MSGSLLGHVFNRQLAKLIPVYLAETGPYLASQLINLLLRRQHLHRRFYSRTQPLRPMIEPTEQDELTQHVNKAQPMQ